MADNEQIESTNEDAPVEQPTVEESVEQTEPSEPEYSLIPDCFNFLGLAQEEVQAIVGALNEHGITSIADVRAAHTVMNTNTMVVVTNKGEFALTFEKSFDKHYRLIKHTLRVQNMAVIGDGGFPLLETWLVRNIEQPPIEDVEETPVVKFDPFGFLKNKG